MNVKSEKAEICERIVIEVDQESSLRKVDRILILTRQLYAARKTPGRNPPLAGNQAPKACLPAAHAPDSPQRNH